MASILIWDYFSEICDTPNPCAYPFGVFEMPNFSAISLFLDDPRLPELRCPLLRHRLAQVTQVTEVTTFSIVDAEEKTHVTGGSVLDAVIYATVRVFIEQDSHQQEVNLNDWIQYDHHDPSASFGKVLQLVSELVCRQTPSEIFGDLLWLLPPVDGLWAGIQLAIAAGLIGRLGMLQTVEGTSFLHERVVMVAMIDGWPESAIRCLRRHGAVARLSIKKACEALSSMIQGAPSPLDKERGAVFFSHRPNLPDEIKYGSSDLLVPFKSLDARLAAALAWHSSETLFADFLWRTMAAAKLSLPGGVKVRLPVPALEHVDAFLFGERISLERSDKAPLHTISNR